MANLQLLQRNDFSELATLAETVWYQHYPSIISREQIAYMLNGRYTDEKLSRYLDSSTQWCWLLRESNQSIGYVSCALAPRPDQLKLEQLYLLSEHKGRGLGKLMMNHVFAWARQHHCRSVWLTVNKNNVDSIAVYQKTGFYVREEAQFDIGHGYIMDDYVMEIIL